MEPDEPLILHLRSARKYALYLRGNGASLAEIWQALADQGLDRSSIETVVRHVVDETLDDRAISRSILFSYMLLAAGPLLLVASRVIESVASSRFLLGAAIVSMCVGVAGAIASRRSRERRIGRVLTEEIGPYFRPRVTAPRRLDFSVDVDVEVSLDPYRSFATCEHCGVESEIDADEATRRRFYCPDCGRPSRIDDDVPIPRTPPIPIPQLHTRQVSIDREDEPEGPIAACEHCGELSEINHTEADKGRFYCPHCGRPSRALAASSDGEHSSGDEHRYDIWSDPGELIRRELAAGERLLWSGKPRTGIVFGKQDVALILYTLVWGVLLMMWQSTDVDSDASGSFGIWMIFAVGIGLYNVVGRFFVDASRRGQIAYGLTDRRVIILSGTSSNVVTSLRLDTLNEISLEEKADRSGTILFGRPAARDFWNLKQRRQQQWRALTGEPDVPAFEMIDDARDVYNRIRLAQQERA